MRALTILKSVLFPIGLLAAAAAAIVVGLDDPPSPRTVMPVESVEVASLEALVDAAMDDYEANDANADSAPQQQVVNGWVARDLLRIMATQQASSNDGLTRISAQLEQLATPVAQPADDRPIRLAMIAVLTLVWWALWSMIPTRRTTASSIPLPVPASALVPPPPPQI